MLALLAFLAPIEIMSFDTPAEAMRDLWERRPRVVAFGEYHEIKGAAQAKPAIAHFTDEIMASVPAASDVIVETWITKGNCGETEKQVVQKVETETKRPETTETDIVKLVRLAKEKGHTPHILELTCDEYKSIQKAGGELDYVNLLTVVTSQLTRKIESRLKLKRPSVIVYGGALHNDVFPRKELASFSFAKKIAKATANHYLEVDLYVPEYIASDGEITKQAWYRQYKEQAQPGKTTRVRRGDSSYIILFPTGN
jgi:hypothetical protein